MDVCILKYTCLYFLNFLKTFFLAHQGFEIFSFFILKLDLQKLAQHRLYHALKFMAMAFQEKKFHLLLILNLNS